MDIIDKPRGLIKDFIYVKDNSLSKSFCDEVIKKFDKDSRQRDGIIGKDTNQRVDKSIKDTKDIHISSTTGWEREDKVFFESLKLGLDEYNDYLTNLNDCCKSYPNPTFNTQDTGYKVQKYEPGGCYHWHHDWCLQNGWSRTFTYLWYLNTIEEKDGGWTEFIDGTKVQPKCGSILFFPATWTYVHRGYTTKVPKYLVNGWIYGRPRS